MSNRKPLVSIGLPVYNGEPHVRKALDTLLAQDYENLEIIISDNASTDATAELCRQASAHRPNVVYSRNAKNLGPLKNWLLVLERAQGEYFMWAAHDDYWSPNFVSALTARLEAHPEAVLATPTTIYVSIDEGQGDKPSTPPARGESAIGNLKLLFAENCAGWMYGLYRTDWLRRHIPELRKYPIYGSDMMWLAGICLRHNAVGDASAVMYKRGGRGVFAPKNRLAQIASDLRMCRHFGYISLTKARCTSDRLAALRLSWNFVYRYFIRYHMRSWLRMIISPLRRTVSPRGASQSSLPQSSSEPGLLRNAEVNRNK